MAKDKFLVFDEGRYKQVSALEGDEGAAATLNLHADEGDDTNDKWALSVANGGNLTLTQESETATFTCYTGEGGTKIFADKYAGPVLLVQNDGDNQYRYGLQIQCGADDGTVTRFVRFYDGDGTEAGYISGSGGTVTYATFTGTHEAAVESSAYVVGNDAYPYGTLVKVVSTAAGSKPKQIKYVIATTTAAKDKAVFGVYSENIDPDEVEGTNIHQVFALGDGHIRVNGEGDKIAIGDYICSSATAGIGMKQDDDILHNYTAAKAVEVANWAAGSEAEVKLIACTYHCA
jgi:hypothetical protein